MVWHTFGLQALGYFSHVESEKYGLPGRCISGIRQREKTAQQSLRLRLTERLPGLNGRGARHSKRHFGGEGIFAGLCFLCNVGNHFLQQIDGVEFSR